MTAGNMLPQFKWWTRTGRSVEAIAAGRRFSGAPNGPPGGGRRSVIGRVVCAGRTGVHLESRSVLPPV